MQIKDCLFCKIIKGDIPCYKVWEDDNYLAFLDIHPIKEGHTLVIPKIHLPYIFDIENNELKELILAAKEVSQKLKEVFKPKSGKIGVIVYGLDVDHTHIHLVPLDKPGDLNFNNAKPASKESLEKIIQILKK
jgi:histidine triad (HIT) family protein